MTFESPLQNFLLWGALIVGGNALYLGIRWGLKTWRHRKDPPPPSAYWEHQNGDRLGNPPPRPLDSDE